MPLAGFVRAAAAPDIDAELLGNPAPETRLVRRETSPFSATGSFLSLLKAVDCGLWAVGCGRRARFAQPALDFLKRLLDKVHGVSARVRGPEPVCRAGWKPHFDGKDRLLKV